MIARGGAGRSASALVAAATMIVSSTLGAVLLGADAWLAVKGAVARALIESATGAALDGRPRRPWPWADFTPIARLEIDALAVDRPVLSDASGAVLAFGLGHVPGTARPGEPGVAIVAGHRDGAARFLGALEPGDAIRWTTASGTSSWWVRETWVAPEPIVRLPSGDEPRLWLVTCWPVGGVGVGREERLVVSLSNVMP